MQKFIFFRDKAGIDRVFHARPPHFMGRIVDQYEQHQGLVSKSFEMDGQRWKVELDESYQKALDSKINYILNQVDYHYKKWKHDHQ